MLHSSSPFHHSTPPNSHSHLRHRATSDNVSEKQSEENTLLVDDDDNQSDSEPERVENNSPEPDASGGESQRYPSRPPNRCG